MDKLAAGYSNADLLGMVKHLHGHFPIQNLVELHSGQYGLLRDLLQIPMERVAMQEMVIDVLAVSAYPLLACCALDLSQDASTGAPVQ